MKKKTYKIGRFNCHTYFKPVGHGYEVGCTFGPSQVFTGNFIHSKEATQYWKHLNTELRKFCKKYWIGPKASFTWYRRFLANYLYTNYYAFLDSKFTKYQRTYTTALRRDENKYRRMRKTWNTHDRFPFRTAA